MIAAPMIQRTFVFTRLLGALSAARANRPIRLWRHCRPASRAVGPIEGERTLAQATGSLAGWRRPTLRRRRADAGPLCLGLVDALLELLETRSKRSGELGEPVRAEED